MKVEHRATITLDNNSTWGDILQMVGNSAEGLDIPETAKMKVNYYAGDQRDPSYTQLIFTW